MTPFKLKIVTPDGLIFDGEAEKLIVRTTGGDICILARHMNYGLYRVEGKSDCPRDALNICRMLSLKEEILAKIEAQY